MRRMVLGLVAVVFAGLAGTAAFLAMQEPERPVSPAQVNIGDAEFGGTFTLTDHTGARVSSDELIDGPTLIYFGYTFCPDVCPIDTQVMVETVDLLATRGIEVTPVFITVDPERDTPEELKYYAEALHPDIVALTGSPDDVKRAADAYKVFYQKVEMPDSQAGYLMNHTSYTYLMTPEKGLTALFKREHPPSRIADDIERTLKAQGLV